MVNIYENVSRNKRNSAIVMALFLLFVTGTVYILSQALGYGSEIAVTAFIVSLISCIGSYYFSDSIILSLSGARPASKKQDFHFFTVTENLCLSAQLPMPKLYVIEDTAMNAFATGRDPKHASICATSGLLQQLNRTELEGVIAHELSHVKNYDIRLMSVVTVLVGMIALLADWFFRMTAFGGKKRENRDSDQLQVFFMVAGIILALLSPIIAQLIQLAISRKREFLADASGVALTKYPDGLKQALIKLSKDKEPLEAANKATAHLYIVNPLNNRNDAVGWFAGLFNTHPPIKERIQALGQME